MTGGAPDGVRVAAGPAGNLARLLAGRSHDTERGFVEVDGSGVRRLSYADAWARSRCVAAAVRRTVRSRRDGGPVVLVGASSTSDFVTALVGALLAGARPVPVPDPASRHPRSVERVRAVAAACRPDGVLTSARSARGVDVPWGGPGADAPVVAVGEDDLEHDLEDDVVERLLAAPGPALWQLSSGTTGAPGRIEITPGRVAAHLEQSAEAYGETGASVAVTWVPLHYSMGLVTAVLRPLWSGSSSVVVPTDRFVEQPRLWLEAVTAFRGTHTSSPGAGYAQCVRRVVDTAGLDLASLQVARVAGELVRADTLTAFAEAFAGAGFRASAFAPSYGLSEATLAVTTCRADESPRVLDLDAEALARGTAVPAEPGAAGHRTLVSCGRPLTGTQVRIRRTGTTGPAGTGGTYAVVEGVVGEIEIAGPQVVPDEDPAGPWRRTGDLGFVHGGELYPLGRSLERFQVNGRNVHAAEVEQVVAEAARSLRPTSVLVLPRDGGARTRLEVALELVPGRMAGPELEAVARAVAREVGRSCGVAVDAVWCVAEGALPTTSSGKRRRVPGWRPPQGATLGRYDVRRRTWDADASRPPTGTGAPDRDTAGDAGAHAAGAPAGTGPTPALHGSPRP